MNPDVAVSHNAEYLVPPVPSCRQSILSTAVRYCVIHDALPHSVFNAMSPVAAQLEEDPGSPGVILVFV